MAPAEKLIASVETTSAANCASAVADAPCAPSQSRRRPARSSSSAARAPRTPSPRSTRLAPGLQPRPPASAPWRRRSAAHRLAPDAPAVAERVRAGSQSIGDQRRHRRGRARVDQRAQPDRVGNLEGAELPAVAPAHRAIDVVEAVGRCRARPRPCRAASTPSVRAQEVADRIVAKEQRADAGAGVLDGARPVDEKAKRAFCCGRYVIVAGSSVRIADWPPGPLSRR